MSIERFDIVFAGRLVQGQDPAQAREQMRALFKASDAQLERLFCGQPVTVKRSVDVDTASQYRLAFRQAGALLEIRPVAAATATSAPASAHAAGTPAMTLAPPHSGDLLAYAPPEAPAPPVDISGYSLDSTDTPLDTGSSPPPPNIDTSRLHLVTGSEWTLEDCLPPLLPLPEPDISGLGLETIDAPTGKTDEASGP